MSQTIFYDDDPEANASNNRPIADLLDKSDGRYEACLFVMMGIMDATFVLKGNGEAWLNLSGAYKQFHKDRPLTAIHRATQLHVGNGRSGRLYVAGCLSITLTDFMSAMTPPEKRLVRRRDRIAPVHIPSPMRPGERERQLWIMDTARILILDRAAQLVRTILSVKNPVLSDLGIKRRRVSSAVTVLLNETSDQVIASESVIIDEAVRRIATIEKPIYDPALILSTEPPTALPPTGKPLHPVQIQIMRALDGKQMIAKMITMAIEHPSQKTVEEHIAKLKLLGLISNNPGGGYYRLDQPPTY